MTNIDRDIGTDDKKIAEFIDSLARGRFLILNRWLQQGFDFREGGFK
jgi:hypothetical protein